MKRNEITKAEISLSKSSGGGTDGNDGQSIGFTVDDDWGEEITVHF